MSPGPSKASETIDRLVEALRGYGFDAETKSGRTDLSMHSGVPVAALNELFDQHVENNNAVISLCRLIGLPVEELLRDKEDRIDIVSVFPYEGGKPVRLLIPSELCLSVEQKSLFFLRVASGEDGPSSFLLGTRASGAPQLNVTYIVEDDISIEIMRCTVANADGSCTLAVVGVPDRQVQLSAPSKLRLVSGGQPEPVITGKVLWRIDSMLPTGN